MRERNGFVFYSELFWLFMSGSLFGALIEGIFCYFRYGHWETHTVAVWGPFCIIYGIGAVILYIGAVRMRGRGRIYQFTMFAVSATVVEYLCGAVLKYGLHMRAWDYSKKFMNIDGLVCLKFSVIWGLGGVLFARWCVPVLKRIFIKMKGKKWNTACIVLSIFMAVNLSVTAACISRWAGRHEKILPQNVIERYIDKIWGDDRMQKRFCEWRFLDEDGLNAG